MEQFSLWLESKEPKITGYYVSSHAGNTYNRSKVFPTYHEAWEEKKKLVRNNIPSTISAAFADGTSRQLDNSGWHFNRVGSTVNDYTVERSGRGKTNQSYTGKNDKQYKENSILYRLKSELRPGNMPNNSGELIPERFWQSVNSALDIAVKESNLAHVARLRDYIEENYGETEVGQICINIIDQTMKEFGMEF